MLFSPQSGQCVLQRIVTSSRQYCLREISFGRASSADGFRPVESFDEKTLIVGRLRTTMMVSRLQRSLD
jgi:hypothetical protein